jgi:phosphoribosylformimino-5-aminoimidazole carboxamide ribotide isomerase
MDTATDVTPRAGFDLLAAVDLRSGRVVRLTQGDFSRETVYGDDPVETAVGLVGQGARWLHVVDLDGARGEARQGTVVEAIVRSTAGRAHVEVGGGVRDRRTAEDLFRLGVARVVLGTAALRDPGMVGALISAYGTGRVAAAVDVRDGEVQAHGWEEASGRRVGDVLHGLLDAGVRIFEVTAISRDGTMQGPDVELLGDAVALTAPAGGRVVASGGIRDLDDVLRVRALGCVGAIVGRALYDGGIDLAAATERLLG